jgi:hypothetical protein
MSLLPPGARSAAADNCFRTLNQAAVGGADDTVSPVDVFNPIENVGGAAVQPSALDGTSRLFGQSGEKTILMEAGATGK